MRKTKKYTGSKRKVVAGIVSLTVILTISAGISYADTDLMGSMSSWFSKKTEQAIQSLDVDMKSETERQKELLKKELQRRLDVVASDLDAFTADQKQKHIAVLGQYVQDVLSKTDIQSAADREQVLQKLQAILDSAQAAMDALAASYEAPSLIFVPTKQIQQPVTVTIDVYKPTPTPTTVSETTYGQ